MKKIFSTAFLTGLISVSFGQDIHFSQMIYSPLTLNPALAGANHDMQAIINYKSQWQTVASPYKTMAASFDMRMRKLKMKKGFWAAGINFFNDQAGDAKLNTTNVNLSVAYHVFLTGHSTLGGALITGGGQKSIKPGDLTWGNQFDGVNYNSALPTGENFANSNFSFFDIGAGLVYTYKKSERYMTGNDQRTINAGAAIYHVNRPNNSFINDEKLQMRGTGFVTATIGLGNSHLSVVPALYYNRQGTNQEILAGSYLKKVFSEESHYTNLMHASAVSLGVFYRNKDAVIVKGMFEKGNYSAGIAYDVNVSSLSEVSKRRGGFEIFIRFTTPSPFSQSKSRI